MMEVRLSPPTAGERGTPRRAYLRNVRGHDELLDFSETGAATALIDRLLADGPHAAVAPGQARALPLWAHDLVLAALYRELFGDEIDCRIRCTKCRNDLALTFSLAELTAARDDVGAEDRALLAELRGPDSSGVYELGSIARFRLPAYEDVAELRDLPPEQAERELERRCVLECKGDTAVLDRAMELAGPRIDSDIDSRCPFCQSTQSVPFSLEQFLCTALERERAIVIREVHLLARAYHWSRTEILDMSRRDRRLHVRLVLDETSRRSAP